MGVKQQYTHTLFSVDHQERKSVIYWAEEGKAQQDDRGR